MSTNVDSRDDGIPRFIVHPDPFAANATLSAREYALARAIEIHKARLDAKVAAKDAQQHLLPDARAFHAFLASEGGAVSAAEVEERMRRDAQAMGTRMSNVVSAVLNDPEYIAVDGPGGPSPRTMAMLAKRLSDVAIAAAVAAVTGERQEGGR